MFMQALYLPQEQINKIRNGSAGTSSAENSDSDYTSDASSDKSEDHQPLHKMVTCTTQDIIWDVETGAPIETEYDIMEM